MLSTGPGGNKVTASTARAAATLLVLAAIVGGCRPDPSTSRGTAERFLDAHYVAIDLAEAAGWTSGIARRKVEQEIELTRGQAIDDTTRKPVVHYRLLEEHADGADAVNYLFRGSITVDGSDSFERRWLVTVRREEPGWRVTNWQELGE
jgi:hypothetical protein